VHAGRHPQQRRVLQDGPTRLAAAAASWLGLDFANDTTTGSAGSGVPHIAGQLAVDLFNP
jgi:hypothetical protein